MNLWYTTPELAAAQQEAQQIIDQYNAEIPYYIRGGKVEIRMAWREDVPAAVTESSPLWSKHTNPLRPIHIPEAELLFNGEVVKRDLLDLILIDINRLELRVITQSMKNHQGGTST